MSRYPRSPAVYSRCALVGAAPGIGVRQYVIAADLVVQGIEPKLGSAFAFACNAVCSLWTLIGVARFPNLPVLRHFRVGPELRPLPSAGITRLPVLRPFRHPIAPGLAVTGFRLVDASTTQGASRVASIFLLYACCRHYPGGIAVHTFALFLCNISLPRNVAGRLPHTSFGACSAFTHVTACILTKSLS